MSDSLDGFDHSELATRVRDFVDAFDRSTADRRATGAPPDAPLLHELRRPPSETPGDLDHIMAMVGATIGPGFDSAGAGFLSYIPSGALPSAALGSYLAAATNRYTGASHAAPAAIAIEQSVIVWMIELFGLPDSAGGVLFSGGSIANLTATVTARSRFGDDFGSGVIYTSERAHHSVVKAAHIAGISPGRVRSVATDSARRLDVDALRHALAADRAEGLTPMMIVATGGTTDTGAIDPLDDCADVAEDLGCWFHVDAAYGGFFQLTDRGRALLRGIERADSITVDAHKSLFLPFGVGGLLVRNTADLVDAHEGRGSYMQDIDDNSLPQFYAMGPELTRPNRGLQVWLPLHAHGVGAFRAELDRMLDLARWTEAELAAIDGLVVTTGATLSVVSFAAESGEAGTRRLLALLNDSGHVHVSSTRLDGQFVVRLAYLSQRTTSDVAERVIALLREAMSSDAD